MASIGSRDSAQGQGSISDLTAAELFPAEEQLYKLSKLICCKWTDVARCLEPEQFNESSVMDIITAHPLRVSDQSLAMLVNWRDNVGSQRTTAHLCRALAKAHCRAQAEITFGTTTYKHLVGIQASAEAEVALIEEHRLFEMSEDVGASWPAVACALGFTSHEIEAIQIDNRTIGEQAWKMLFEWYSRMGSGAKENDLWGILKSIRNKDKPSTNEESIFPDNVRDDSRLCGRDGELAEIKQRFWGTRIAQAPTVPISEFCLQFITGLGGVGKSAVAYRYAVQMMSAYSGGVFHFNADSWPVLISSLRENARKLGIDSTRSNSELIQAFNDAVSRRPNVLILYDGADDLSLLETILPHPRKAVHVLVTSRCGKDDFRLDGLNRPHSVTHLGRLGVQEARGALYAWSGKSPSNDDAKEIRFSEKLVREPPVYCLALAVAHAGAAVKKCKIPFSLYYTVLHENAKVLDAAALDLTKLLKYFKIPHMRDHLVDLCVSHPSQVKRLTKESVLSMPFDSRDKRLLLNAIKMLNETTHVHLTWQMDIESIEQDAPEALNVLEYFSLMEHKSIPCYIVQRVAFGRNAVAHYNFRMALSSLSSYTLVDFFETNEGGYCDIHPLVQSTVHERLLQKPRAQMKSRLVRLSVSLLEDLPISVEGINLTDSSVTKLVAHVYAVADKILLFACEDEPCLQLLSLACKIAIENQIIEVANSLCERRLKVVETAYAREAGPVCDVGQLWNALYDMAQSCQLSGAPIQAEEYLKRALDLTETFGEVDRFRGYVLVVTQVARCCLDRQKFREAEKIYLSALSLLCSRPQPNQQEVAAVLHNLGYTYERIGELKEAIDFYQQSLDIKRSQVVNDEVGMVSTLLSLGRCFVLIGDHGNADLLLHQALPMMRRCRPEEHRDASTLFHTLSHHYLRKGDVTKAFRMAEESIEVAKSTRPDDHPDIAICKTALADCHRHSGDIDKALAIYNECSQVLRTNRCVAALHLVAVLNGKGLCLTRKLLLTEAAAALQESIDIQRRTVSRSSPDLATSNLKTNLIVSVNMASGVIALANLAAVYMKERNHLKASELYKESLQIYEQSSPPLLTNIAYIAFTLGKCYCELYRLDEAEAVLKKCQNVYGQILPPGHPNRATVEQLLRMVMQKKLGY